MSIFLTILTAAIFAAPANALPCIMQNPVADFSTAVITDYFRAPNCEQCSGNRGIELQLQQGQPILAVSDGIISYYGEVSRTKYLVLLTNNNRRITYGKIAVSKLRAGDRVFAGQQVATSGPNLYFGIREVLGSVVQYVDPLKYLADAMNFQRRAVLISDTAAQSTVRNPVNLQC